MAKICSNDSVGVIIRKGDQYATIKRLNYPVAYAFVAGHLDGASPETQARAEASEEVQTTIDKLEKKIEGLDLENPCKREGGSHHVWYVFDTLAPNAVLKPGSDAEEAFWSSREQIHERMDRTRMFAKKHGVELSDLTALTLAVVGDPKKGIPGDPEWEKEPGFEPVWTLILDKIGF